MAWASGPPVSFCARDGVSLKADYLWVREPENFSETRATLEQSIADYNENRPHSSLGYLTPIEYRKKKMEEQEA